MENKIKDILKGLQINNYVKTKQIDNITITIGQLADDNYFILTEKEGQEDEASYMIMDESTFWGIATTSLVYAEHSGIDLNEKIKSLCTDNKLKYTFKDKNIHK